MFANMAQANHETGGGRDQHADSRGVSRGRGMIKDVPCLELDLHANMW